MIDFLSESIDFNWMQSKMNCWILFKSRLKSLFMILSGFLWIDSRINTWGFNQWIFNGLSSGDSWMKSWINVLWSLFWGCIESSLQGKLGWYSFGFLLGLTLILLRTHPMNQLKSICWRRYKVYYTHFTGSCQDPLGFFEESSREHSDQTSTRLFIKSRIYTWENLWYNWKARK